MRVIPPEQLSARLAGLPSHPRVVASGNAATPWTALGVLDKAVEEYTLHVLNAQPGIPDRAGVVLETPFVGPGMRGSPRLAYVPARLSLVPLLFRGLLRPDVVLLHTTSPVNGVVSLGPEVNVLPAAIEAARDTGGLVVAQFDETMPFVYGDGVLATDDIDLAITAVDSLRTLPPPIVDPDSVDVADYAASMLADGATIQLGIGKVPDAVLVSLLPRRGLRVWSEMVSDGILALEQAGSLDGDSVVTASFLIGSGELYQWADRNARLRLLRTESTNDPARIAAQPQMTSVNTALQVDLFGQVNASRIAGRIHSGFGGQTDFIVGALHSPGGQAIIALRSWHPKADCSTIIPLVDEPVTSFQPSAVVTENGVARLWGRSESEQARSLIEAAAHPDVRDDLREEAVALGLW